MVTRRTSLIKQSGLFAGGLNIDPQANRLSYVCSCSFVLVLVDFLKRETLPGAGVGVGCSPLAATMAADALVAQLESTGRDHGDATHEPRTN